MPFDKYNKFDLTSDLAAVPIFLGLLSYFTKNIDVYTFDLTFDLAAVPFYLDMTFHLAFTMLVHFDLDDL